MTREEVQEIEIRHQTLSRNWTPLTISELTNTQVIALCQSWLTLEQRVRELEEEKRTAVRNFVLGKDKYCAVCGATEPCELKDDPMSPCSFDPTPMELMKDNKRLGQIVDALHADLEQAQAEIAALKKRLAMFREKLGYEAEPYKGVDELC